MTEPKNPIRAHQARKSLTTFPFKKSASACNCGKYNLQNIPQLQVGKRKVWRLFV